MVLCQLKLQEMCSEILSLHHDKHSIRDEEVIFELGVTRIPHVENFVNKFGVLASQYKLDPESKIDMCLEYAKFRFSYGDFQLDRHHTLLYVFQYFHGTWISTQDNTCHLSASRLQFCLRY